MHVSHFARNGSSTRSDNSAEQDIPGGGPQGGLLTVIFFDLQVNLAGAPCPRASFLPLGHAGPEPDPQLAGPPPLCHLADRILKKKYVDDLSMLEVIKLKRTLVPSPPIIGPPNFHEQAGLLLPADQSVLQHQLADLLVFTNDNLMKSITRKPRSSPSTPQRSMTFSPNSTFLVENRLKSSM